MKAITTYDRLLPIINQIDKTIICQSVTDNGNGTYTFLCNYTKWLTAGFDLTIGLNTYTIVSFVCNESITVSGTTLPLQLTFDLYAPFFKHGTIQKVSQEIDAATDHKSRLPLIFLHEILEEKLHFDQLDAIELDVDLRIYFLTDCDFKNWTQLQGDTLAIQPMLSLRNEFIKVLSVSQYVAELTGVGNSKNYNVFGNVNDNGTAKNIFNMFLSGVQLKIGVAFLRDCECCEDNLLDNRPAPGYVYDINGNILAILYSNEIYINTHAICVDVLIKNLATGETITTVASGGEYNVTVLTEIQDTIDNNTITIIDPII